ncbi:MAG: hypothetical protein KKD44_26585, partial [Proteobacteria bacterium]|nr:hypothetical protein [Pseudomonadota bacterium]
MRKNSRTTLFLFLLAGILILYMIASENPALRLFSIAPRASGRYTIVTSDMWSVDSQIRDFATWRQAQGFTMSTVSLSQIYSAYPIPSYPSSPLKVQTIYGVTGSRIEGSVLYYRVGSGISLFGIVNLSGAYYAKSSPATPQDLFVWCSNYWISEISLTIDYSDGSTRKSITIKPRICPYKQDVIVLSSGQVQALETGAWSVARYLESYGSDYLLIIGDETVVPAFPAKYFVFGFSGGDLTISSGVCDDPYWKAPWSLFVWSRAVGRIPTTSISNVYSVLTKTRSAAFNTKRALYFKGDPLDVSPSAWDADYNALVSSTFTNGLHVWDPRYTKTEYDKPTDAIMRSALNSGNDFVFIFAHGNPGNFYITSTVWLSASDLASILFSQSMVMFTLSCEVADFSKACILESFLF